MNSCAFSTNEACLEWFKRLHKVTFPRRAIEEMFAFAYYAWSMDEKKSYPRLGKDPDSYLTTFKSEVCGLFLYYVCVHFLLPFYEFKIL